MKNLVATVCTFVVVVVCSFSIGWWIGSLFWPEKPSKEPAAVAQQSQLKLELEKGAALGHYHKGWTDGFLLAREQIFGALSKEEALRRNDAEREAFLKSLEKKP